MKNFKHHFKRIFEISFPLTLATAAGTILILIDSFFATRISIESYEAVFLTLPIMGLATGIGIGLAAAIADLVSKEKDLEQIKRLISSSFVLTAFSVVVFLYITLFHPDWIERVAGLHRLEDGSRITSEFRTYWSIVLWTFPVQVLFSITMQFLTMLEKQRMGLYIIAFNIALNVCLDYLFTQILGWGISGLGYATMSVFTVGVLLSFIPLRKEAFFQWPYPSLMTAQFLGALAKMSLTSFLIFISVAIFSVSAIIMNQMALAISTKALVIYAIYGQIMRLFIITTRGLAGGFIIYLGTALRDKKTADYFPIYWAATAWIGVINIIGAILMLVIPTQLIQLYDNVDPALYPQIIYFLTLGALIMVLQILPRMATVGFISLNKSYLLVVHSISYVIIQIATAYYWTQSYGTDGLIDAELAASVFGNLLFLPIFYYLLNQVRKRDSAIAPL